MHVKIVIIILIIYIILLIMQLLFINIRKKEIKTNRIDIIFYNLLLIIAFFSLFVMYIFSINQKTNKKDKIIEITEDVFNMECVEYNNFSIDDFIAGEIQQVTLSDDKRLYPCRITLTKTNEEEYLITYYTPTGVNNIWKKVKSKPIDKKIIFGK